MLLKWNLRSCLFQKEYATIMIFTFSERVNFLSLNQCDIVYRNSKTYVYGKFLLQKSQGSRCNLAVKALSFIKQQQFLYFDMQIMLTKDIIDTLCQVNKI